MNGTSAFDAVYELDLWNDGGLGSGSGPGSSLEATRTISALLVHLILTMNLKSMLDVPCGGMRWMPSVIETADDLYQVDGLLPFNFRRGAGAGDPPAGAFQYTGVDIVGSVVNSARARHGAAHPMWEFIHGDVTMPSLLLSRHDLVVCRDLFFHLSAPKIAAAIANFRRSGSTWLLASHNPHMSENSEALAWRAGAGVAPQRLPPGFAGGLDEGGYRPVNLLLPPYNLPPPVWQYMEWLQPEGTQPDGSEAAAWDKAVAFWRIDTLEGIETLENMLEASGVPPPTAPPHTPPHPPPHPPP